MTLDICFLVFAHVLTYAKILVHVCDHVCDYDNCRNLASLKQNCTWHDPLILQEYHIILLAKGMPLLADIFKNLRDVCMMQGPALIY